MIKCCASQSPVAPRLETGLPLIFKQYLWVVIQQLPFYHLPWACDISLSCPKEHQEGFENETHCGIWAYWVITIPFLLTLPKKWPKIQYYLICSCWSYAGFLWSFCSQYLPRLVTDSLPNSSETINVIKLFSLYRLSGGYFIQVRTQQLPFPSDLFTSLWFLLFLA